jgi:hypothetical protein
MFYVLTCEHTAKNDKWLNFWGPKNAGYYYSEGMIGEYESPEKGYHDSDHSIPIPKEVAERLFITVNVEGVDRRRIPNCRAVLDEMGLIWGRDTIKRKVKQ